MPENFGLQRVRSKNNFPQCMIDCRSGNLRRLQALAERLAPAGDAFVGLDLDQGRAAARHPALRERERLRQRRAQHVRPDIRDLHAMPTWESRGIASAGRLRIISTSSLFTLLVSKILFISCGSSYRS